MSPKLQYFDLRGLGEYIRTLLIDNKIEFEDERIQMGEEWEAKKKTMPLGQMPVWNEGEKRIPQSGAILRHLGRTHDLYGETECDRVLIDVMQESLKDMRFKYAMQVVFGDFDKKDEYDKETYPLELQKIEKLFKTRNEGKQFVLGEKISFVDYVLFEELELALTSNANNLETVPVLKAFHERFSQRPNLKTYLAKRAADKPVFHGNYKI